MRYVQLSNALFVGHMKAMMFACIAVFILCLFMGAPGVGASSPTVPAGGQPHETTMTSTDFKLTWTALPSRSAYQVRATKDQSALQNNSVIWQSSWIETNELPFLAIDGAEDGVWYWQVRSRDVLENVSDWSEVWRISVDTTPPGVVIVKPEAVLHGKNTASSIEIEILVEDECDGRCAVELDGVDITQQLHVTSVNNRTTLRGEVSTGLLSDGSHMLVVGVADEHGNAIEQLRLIAVDNTAPLLASPIEDNWQIRGIVPLQFSIKDSHPGMHQLVVMRGDSRMSAEEAGLLEPVETEPGVWRYSWDTTRLTRGIYQLVFTAMDEAGNEATLLRTVEVVPSALALMGAGATDPLLEQLSRQLSQPFVERPLAESSLDVSMATIAAKINLQAHTGPGHMIADQSKSSPLVAPSENGWRIFGILWYWWLSAMALLTIAYRRLKVTQVLPA